MRTAKAVRKWGKKVKRLECEACGSADMVKENGMFVCQYCGARYSVEETKRMMTVTIDNSDSTQKALANARRAKEKEDWEECEKYYNMVERNDPKNIEAIFYSVYGKTKATMIEADKYKKEQAINVLKKSVSIVDDNYDVAPEKYEENKKLITQMNTDLLALMNGQFVFTQTKHTQNGITTYSDDSSYTHNNFYYLSAAWIETLQNIIKLMEKSRDTLYLWILIRSQYDYQLRSGRKRGFNKKGKEYLIQKINEIDQKIQELNPSYQPKDLPEVKTPGESTAGFLKWFFIVFGIIFGILLLILLGLESSM